MNKFIRLFNTVKYLKLIQIYFRVYYFIRNRYRKKIGFNYEAVENVEVHQLSHINSISSYTSYENECFNFLNLSHKFNDDIDWNYSDYGKLWTYNLNYFDFLNQKDIDTQEAIYLINDFIGQEDILKDALEPFPISLRGINWIKFLTNKKINDKKINKVLYKHYNILLDNLEYHLLGNHLLENGFSLLFGAYYFKDEKFYKKAKEILEEELKEQILDDGAHFELSPMYHQIMLYRLLDSVNLIKHNAYKDQELLSMLENKASVMLGWLKNITYENGDIPLLNDSANGIAPTSTRLFQYAKELGTSINELSLSESGYRKISTEKYECVVDVGDIRSVYIPGHSHADTFNFELRIDNRPFIVDSGISTYEMNDTREFQRSTLAHNTVEVSAKDSSEVWGSFRIGNRAKIIELKESDDNLESTHDGYRKYGILHTRCWKFKNDKITIIDNLSKNASAVFRLHFHPSVDDEMITKYINLEGLKFKILDYKYAQEFNHLIDAKYIEINFDINTEVEINI